MRWEDLKGRQFGELIAIEYLGNKRWKCLCSCGKEVDVSTYGLTKRTTTSCGHTYERAFKDIAGQNIGEWKVIRYLGKQFWECECSCGNIVAVSSMNLMNGRTMSYGHSVNHFIDVAGQTMSTNEVLTSGQTIKHKLVALGLGTQEESEESIMTGLGYLKIYDSGNLEFTWKASEI